MNVSLALEQLERWWSKREHKSSMVTIALTFKDFATITPPLKETDLDKDRDAAWAIVVDI